jgi:hypothetical protein
VNRRGGRIKRLCAGSESEESGSLESAASDDDGLFAFDWEWFCPADGKASNTFVGGEMDSRCNVAFVGLGLFCRKWRLCTAVFAEDVRLRGGAV